MKLVIDIDEEEYNRIRHFCSFSDNNIPLGWYEIAKSKPLQAELEEIKIEIEADKRLWLLKEDVYEILDNRISELKGENNE